MLDTGTFVVLSAIAGRTSESGVFISGIGALVVIVVLVVGAVMLVRSRHG